MKHLFKFLGCTAVFAAMLAGFTSCDGSSVQHRGGGAEPEIPSRPGETDEPGETSGDITLQYGYGEFWGPYYSSTTDNYLIYLYEGDTDADGNFTASAHMLTLDIVLPATTHDGSSNINLREGVYKCSDEDDRTYIFVPAYDTKNENGEIVMDGSTLYVQKDRNHFETLGVTDGTLEVKQYITGQYGVEATIVAGGREHKFHYKGFIGIDDMTQESEPPVEDTSFPGSDKYELRAKAQYNGELYEGSDDYTVFLYYGEYDANGDFVTLGTETVFELLTDPSDGKTIQARTYSSTADDFTAGHVLEGFEDKEKEIIYPSYIYRQYDNKGNFSLELINSATVTVSGSKDNYGIVAYFSTASGSYSLRYEGPLKIDDASGTQGGAAAKAAR